jgi:hypothetical protein
MDSQKLTQTMVLRFEPQEIALGVNNELELGFAAVPPLFKGERFFRLQYRGHRSAPYQKSHHIELGIDL